MICTMLNHLENDELLSIGFLMSTRCAFRENTVRYLGVTSELFFFGGGGGFFFSVFFLSRRNIFDPAPEIGYKEMFLITLVETLYAAQLHPSLCIWTYLQIIKSLIKEKVSPNP